MKRFGKLSRQCSAFICTLSVLVTVFLPALAQKPATPVTRALTHQDYDTWRSIVSPQISRDGKFVAYAYMAQDADSDIVVRNLATGAEWRAPRGYRPPAPPPDVSIPGSAELIAEQARLVRPHFTADNRFVAFGIEPAKAELNKAKKEKKRPEEMPKNALGLMNLSSGEVTKIERVKNFQVPEDGSGFIAYLKEAKPSTDGRDGAGGNPTVREGANANKPAEGPKSDPPAVAAAPSPPSGPTAREGAIAGKPAERTEGKAELPPVSRRATERYPCRRRGRKCGQDACGSRRKEKGLRHRSRPAKHDDGRGANVQRRPRLHSEQRREDARLHRVVEKRRNEWRVCRLNPKRGRAGRGAFRQGQISKTDLG
jgi:hypothetical protein